MKNQLCALLSVGMALGVLAPSDSFAEWRYEEGGFVYYPEDLTSSLHRSTQPTGADCRPLYQRYLSDHNAAGLLLIAIPLMAMPPMGLAAAGSGVYSAVTNPRFRKALRVINDAYAGGGKTLRKLLREVREEIPNARGEAVAEIIVSANEKGAFCQGEPIYLFESIVSAGGQSLALFDDMVSLVLFELQKERNE